jgi:hypothetical protein
MRYHCLLATVAALSFTTLARGQSPAPTPTPTRIRLSRDTVVAGIRCGPTGRAYAALHANGALEECPLAADSLVEGNLLAKGSWIRLTPEGILDGAWLLRDAQLQGLPCKGTGYKGWAVRFHPDGRLALCYLSREATIDAIPCKAGAFISELSGSTQVMLHHNGKLQSCRVARDVTYRGVALRGGKRVRLSPDGALVAAPASPGA